MPRSRIYSKHLSNLVHYEKCMKYSTLFSSVVGVYEIFQYIEESTMVFLLLIVVVLRNSNSKEKDLGKQIWFEFKIIKSY